MTVMDWIQVFFGLVFIAVGIAFFASRRFGQLALTFSSQGVMWRRMLGDTWAPIASKFLFAGVSVACGVWGIYTAIYGYP